jgi:glutamate synthase (NADPH) large chain
MAKYGHPKAQGLYVPSMEKDACGVGFVVNVKGRQSHDIVQKGLQALHNLTHRGAIGSDASTGDGAGILLQVPHAFLAREAKKLDITLGEAGSYGVGMLYFPTDDAAREAIQNIYTSVVEERGLEILGWREIPVDNSTIGDIAQSAEPVMMQVFIARGDMEEWAFERELYIIRRLIYKTVKREQVPHRDQYYVCSISAKTILYKGQLTAKQLAAFYPDLHDEEFVSALSLVHSRYSTNTFPSWPLAQPFRTMCHNGEINTLRGNINWMSARQSLLKSDLFGEDLEKVLPVIIDEEGSDSAIFDNVLEFLMLTGRELPHAVMMMIPEAWENYKNMNPDKLGFYQFHASIMEPWDGPASIAFTNGSIIGATLDRNGLRPSRYVVTKDDLVIMASEVGVIDVEPENVEYKGRLQPGRMFLVDTVAGRIIGDEELKARVCQEYPYTQWVANKKVLLEDLPEATNSIQPNHETLLQRQQTFGYTQEDEQVLLKPMAIDGVEPTGSMGTDTPLAVLSDRPQLLFNYFKQLFAQVTNPPVDPIREKLVFSLNTYLGAEGNLLDTKSEQCRLLALPHPILLNSDLEKIRQAVFEHFKAKTISTVYPIADGAEGLEKALEGLADQASTTIEEGYSILILSDRDVSETMAPIPCMLALGAVNSHLIKEGTRTRVSIVIESGEPREVMHFALLIGYGASAVNPYLAFETLADLKQYQFMPEELEYDDGMYNYIKAINKGLLKVFSKMGISAIQSYQSAQIFEAVGLHEDLINRYFPNTISRIGGIGLDVLHEEVRMRHAFAFGKQPSGKVRLELGGQYHWRHRGEYHLNNPEIIATVQKAVRNSDYKVFKKYSRLVNAQHKKLCTLRGLLQFKKGTNIPLDSVEPASEIVKRFVTGAMSFGSISREAHETLAIAMNRLGGRSNSGEGGEDPARYTPDANGDSRCSAIKQIASGRFGVSSFYNTNARELQIKMAQGAKPGEGGQLPGSKVSKEIARVRNTIPGVTLISPPPHHDIYSIEDLSQLIFDLKNSNPQAHVSVKLVSQVGVGTVAAGVSKGLSDLVLISGHDGGTGASPISSIKHAGIPWEIGLSETQQVLVMNNLRGRIRVQVDGQLKTGRDVVIGAMLGADEFGFATTALIAEGCVMMRKCHKGTCSVGIATQNKELRKRFKGKPEHVVNFFMYIAEEIREVMASLGFRRFDDMIGRVDMLGVSPEARKHWKAKGLEFDKILHKPDAAENVAVRHVTTQLHELEQALDHQIIKQAQPAIEHKQPVVIDLPVKNSNRAVGAMLANQISIAHGAEGLPDNTIHIHLRGSAGQSLGAFNVNGVTMELTGDANDYLGKCMSGGRIIVYPPKGSTIVAEENIIVGNVLFYGATSGEAYINGMAGERFCVRNSGVNAVVEGVGDHGCEYMTGGSVVVLGATGRNFAAGMSGGVAYVLKYHGLFAKRCNREMVDLEPVVDQVDKDQLQQMIHQHHQYTNSSVAKSLLDNWDYALTQFVKVMPREYRRVLAEMAREQSIRKNSAQHEAAIHG